MKTIEDLKKLPLSFQIALIALVAIIIFYAARMIKRRWNSPQVNYNNIPVVGGGGFGGGTSYSNQNGEIVQWNPDPLAQEIATNLHGWNFQAYPETVDQINKLQTDDQVKLLYNHYNEKYSEGKTLTQLIAGEWVVEYGEWQPYRDAIARLKALNLH